MVLKKGYSERRGKHQPVKAPQNSSAPYHLHDATIRSVGNSVSSEKQRRFLWELAGVFFSLRFLLFFNFPPCRYTARNMPAKQIDDITPSPHTQSSVCSARDFARRFPPHFVAEDYKHTVKSEIYRATRRGRWMGKKEWVV